jgi:hypothetical protein
MLLVSSAGRFVRGLFFLAVCGLVALALIGPVVAVVSLLLSLALTLVAVALPFALIGLAVWLPYLILSRDPKKAWHNLRAGAAAAGKGLAAPLRGSARVCRWGAHQVRSLAPHARPLARSVVRGTQHVVDRAVAAGEVALPAVADAAVRAGKETGRVGRSVVVRARPAVRFLGGVVLEAASGAAVGALLLALADLGRPDLEVRMGLGAAAGAFVGLVVGAVTARARSAARSGAAERVG